jgi:hypothetical protein
MGEIDERIIYTCEWLHRALWPIVNLFMDIGPSKVFGVPPLARKAKPFVDHILTFSILDSKIWFRNFQVGPFRLELNVSYSRITWYRSWKRTHCNRTDLPRCHW